ncbi:hypothetical protein PHLGIDRAFT_34440 [Phlebiopsis gigantea 11061_1 CR5-6]|uniref:Extracellular membrane protein CFEM domain-containing protein n=1 Tax=Phlebiopsis gigantea (strain 11061_1 CR5-6) TaxID=745531 RepID=A0A0C3SD66_PHLG1|nr:hypothetical protein PHLGIDRAFT_34440 [Phlebiopsis gigantea 11061_1 CR5-6]
MLLLSIYIAFFALLAGRVYSLNITVPGMGNLTQTQFLKLSDATLISVCGQTCTGADTIIAACGTDEGCVCANATAQAVYNCEQCVFTELIKENRPMPDVLSGNQVVLTSYKTACAAAPLNVTIPAEFVTLQLPSDWDGPFGQGLTTFTTAVYLASALIIGGGAITVVNTM